VVSAATQELDPVGLQGWALMDALVWRSFGDDPTRASRPFDARREGFVPGEGAGAVILETLAGARARGARIHAELLGGVSTCDATRLPKPVVEGQVRAMRGALRDAGITPEQVNYINAHATSTVVGDAVEVEAIKQVFGDHAYRIPINATKSMLGHCLTAACLVELVALLMQMEDGYCTRPSTSTSRSWDLTWTSCPMWHARTTSRSRFRIRLGSAGSTPAWSWAGPHRGEMPIHDERS